MKILAHDDKNEIVLVAFTGAVIKILYFRKSLPLLLQSVQIWKQFFDMNRDNEQLFTSNLFAEYVWDTTLLIVSSAIRLNYLYHQFYCSNTNDKYFTQVFNCLWNVSLICQYNDNDDEQALSTCAFLFTKMNKNFLFI